jgi:tetratricopeptide (TPR) repeat protein
MAKPTLVTLPCVLLLLDAWPLARLGPAGEPTRIDARRLWRALLEKLPLLALVAADCVVVVLAQQAGGAMVDLEQIPLGARVANALVAWASYLHLAFWPTGLAVFYPHPAAGIGFGWAALAFGLVAGLTLAAGAAWRRRPYLLVGWLWFLGMLVPTLGLVQVGAQAIADRYAYLPLTGLAIAVAWGVPDLLVALGIPPRARRIGLIAAAVAAITALSAVTAVQIRTWRDSEALFRHALAVTRDNHIAHAHLGDALLGRGQARQAVAHWEESLRLRPGLLEVANNLAWLLATTPTTSVRDSERALALAEQALAIAQRPQAADAAERASVLDTLAAAQAAAGRFADAGRTAAASRALAEQSGDPDLAAEIFRREALYRSGQAYTEH